MIICEILVFFISLWPGIKIHHGWDRSFNKCIKFHHCTLSTFLENVTFKKIPNQAEDADTDAEADEK